LDELVNRVVTELESRLNKPGVFILASPGCSRGLLVTELLRRGLVDAVYAYDKFGSKVGEDVRGRVIEFRKIDELAGKLGNVNGRVAVVARSTADAVRLRDKLGKAEVIYLPEYYEDAAKKVLKGVDLEVSRVKHEGLGEGISPSMLREDSPSKDVESIRELSLGKNDLKDVIRDFLKKAPLNVATQAVIAGLSFLLGVGATVSLVGSLVGRFLESVVGRWRKNRDEVIGGFVRLLRVAREVKNYLDDKDKLLRDERLEAVFDEVAYEWGLNIEEFTDVITNIANIAEGKQLTEEDIKKLINDNLENFKKELDKVNEKLKELKVGEKGQKIGVEVFFVDDVENGLLYGNFIVEGGVPKIITWVGTAKDDLKTDLVDAGKFREVAEEVFSRLVKNGRVVLVGPRGIGKSTLATYVVWRSLFGGLDNMVLNEPVYAVIRANSLNPGYALALNNLIKTDGRRFVVIYDPSSVMAYYKPEAMQVVEHGNKSDENITLRKLIESVKTTLKELIEVRNAWVVVILPSELYEQVQRGKEEDVDLRQVLDNLERDVVTVDLRNEVFLREVIKRYSECNNVSDDMVRRVMNFDSYTLVAKYAGVWLHEKKCEVEDVEKALRESADKPKLFFAHYIWGVILGKSMDLAKKVSVPLILHATFGPIPEGITYITKAVNKGGKWKLIDWNKLARSKLEGLREDDLEPIAKWLSTWHEDLIEETLRELVGLRGEEARNNYRNHGFKDFIDALNWGYEEALGEGRGILGLLFGEITHGETSVEEFMKNLVKKLEQLIENAKELKEVMEHDQMLVIIYQQLLTEMKALQALLKETKAESNLFLNLGINLPILVFMRLIIALKPLANCWKRAALIIGNALTGYPTVPRPEDLRIDIVESLGDALKECDVDYYLLVGNKMPPLIIGLLIRDLPYTLALIGAFIDKYNKAVAEVNRILNIARGRGISVAESFYGLGLASIIADAARLGWDVKPGGADIALHIASFTIRRVVLPDLIKLVLGALEPLHGKAPHRYLILLATASNMENLDHITVRYIFEKLNKILDKYGDVVRRHAWSLVYAIDAYAFLLRTYLGHFNSKEVGDMVGRVVDLLNVLDGFNSSLGVIAWAVALAPALKYEDVRRLMEEKLGIDVVDKASKVLKELNDKKERVQELMGDKEFMNYIESRSLKADEETVKGEIRNIVSLLKDALAHYRLDNNELIEAKDLFKEAFREFWEIGEYENYLIARGWVLRVEAIKGSLANKELKELVDRFKQLYEETFNKKPFMLTAKYLSIASGTLGKYLVSLALTGDQETINKLLKKHLWVLNADKRVSVLTRLMLNALLSPRGGLNNELKGKLSFNPEELIYAFGYEMRREYLPALGVALGMISPEKGYEECKSIEDSTGRRDCRSAVLAVTVDSVGIWRLRGKLIKYYKRILENERSGWLRELGFNTNVLISEFEKLVYGLDGKSLARLLAINSSMAQLALLLHALIDGNGNKELAKALTLYGATYGSSKLLRRLFLEAYKECRESCDLGKDELRHALARLFFYHV